MKFKKLSLGLCIALTVAACNSNKPEKDSLFKAESNEASADSVGTPKEVPSELPGTDAKLVKTADINFKVKDVYKSSDNIHRNVKKLGGLVMHNDIKTLEIDSQTTPLSGDSLQVISSYKVEAEMTVKVPSANLSDFVHSIASDATIIYTSNFDIEDRSIDHLGSRLKQQSRQRILNKELQKDTLQTDELLQLANQNETIIDQKMDNLRTDAAVKYSSITLSFTQTPLIKRETVPNDNLNVYQPPVSKRFTDALSGGYHILLSIVVGVSYLWPFIVLGFGGWLTYRNIKRRVKLKV